MGIAIARPAIRFNWGRRVPVVIEYSVIIQSQVNTGVKLKLVISYQSVSIIINCPDFDSISVNIPPTLRIAWAHGRIGRPIGVTPCEPQNSKTHPACAGF